jgi:hypothetical protein
MKSIQTIEKQRHKHQTDENTYPFNQNHFNNILLGFYTSFMTFCKKINDPERFYIYFHSIFIIQDKNLQ